MADSSAVGYASLDTSRLILTRHAVLRFQERHAVDMSYSEAEACLSRALNGGMFQRISERKGETWLCIFRDGERVLSFRFSVQSGGDGFLCVTTVLPKIFDPRMAERDFKRMRSHSPTWKRQRRSGVNDGSLAEEEEDGC